ncbi:MAG: hypothetical protein AB8E15_11795 [Bdellovibrionales bacterium]
MQVLILSIWLTQGLLMFLDEFVFHHKRGLKKWERIGHPVDTFFFVLPFIYTLFFSNISIFIGLCALSCLIITKDEFVHSEECEANEQWLHSVLFVLHPIALFGLWLAWQNQFMDLILVQMLVISSFMLYQIIYWNFIVGQKNESKS